MKSFELMKNIPKKNTLLIVVFYLFSVNVLGITIDPGNKGKDTAVYKNMSIKLGGSPTATDGLAPYKFTWKSDDGSFSSSSENPVATPTKTTVYTVEVEDADGFKCEKSVKVIVFEIELDEATFSNNNALRKDNGTYMSNGTGDVRVPQIKKGETSTEVCYKWESSPSISVKFTIKPDLGSLSLPVKIKIENSSFGLVYEQDVTLSGSALSPPAFIVKNSSMKFPKEVKNASLDLRWIINIGGNDKDITSTSNKLFVTAGIPSGDPATITRINRLTSACSGLGNETEILKKIWKNVIDAGNFNLNAGSPPNLWSILDGINRGDCNALSNLFLKTIQVIGITPGYGQVMYCYPGPNKTAYENPSPTAYHKRSCKIGDNGHDSTHISHSLYVDWERIGYVDGAGGLNKWEATFKYRDNASGSYIWFAPGTGGEYYYSVQEVMEHVVDFTEWRYYTSASSITPCINPGPRPEKDW